MFKLIKYEIKGCYKFFLGAILTMMLALTILQVNHRNQILNNYRPEDQNVVMQIFTSLSIISLIILLTAIVIYLINAFKKDLDTDQGYLTFSLPLNGYEVIGAKLATAVITLLATAFLLVAYNQILSSLIFTKELSYSYTLFESLLQPLFLKVGFFSFIALITSLLLIYLAIALSKVSLKNRKIGGYWFIIFIGLIILVGSLENTFSEAIPLYMDIDTINFTTTMPTHTFIEQTNLLSTSWINNFIIQNYYQAKTYLNVTNFIVKIFTIIAAFVATGYLLDNNIDL